MMKKILLSGRAMKQADTFCIQHRGKTSLELMEAAATAVKREIPADSKKILVLVGAGNNGADGLAAARLFLQEQGSAGAEEGWTAPNSTTETMGECTVTVVECVDIQTHRATEEYLQQKTWLQEAGKVRWLRLSEFLRQLHNPGDSLPYDCILDSVFGVGLRRPVEGELADCFDRLNQRREQQQQHHHRQLSGSFPYVIATDIPSGVNADDGAVLGTALRADKTVTFGWEKIGLVCYPGAEFAGEIVTADIGYPEGLLEAALDGSEGKEVAYTITGDALLPPRGKNTHKGSYGKLLVIAGSHNMAGAAYFCGAAAYASGTGLVRLMTPEENRVIMQTLLPEAVLCTYEESNALDCVKEHMAWADHILLGPGLSEGETARELTEYVIKEHRVPLLVDADGLNCLAKHPQWYQYLTGQDVLTPHPAELARLLRKTEGVSAVTGSRMIEAGRELQRQTGAVCVCKSARTLVFTGDDSFYINTSGNDGMATAGMGDVLAGMIAGFMAGGMSSAESAVNGVYLHGTIGDEGTERFSAYALTAGKMVQVYREIVEREITETV